MNRSIGVCARLALVVCLGLLAGCGYTFRGSGSVLPVDVKNVYIPRVENLSTEGSLTALLTESLRDEFERYGAVSVVDVAADADAILKAKVLKVTRDTRTSTSNSDTALQMDTQLSVAAELRRVTGQVLWRDNNINVSKMFGSTSDVVVTTSADFAGSTFGANDLSGLDSREVARGQEREALASLSEDVAKKIYADAVAPEF